MRPVPMNWAQKGISFPSCVRNSRLPSFRRRSWPQGATSLLRPARARLSPEPDLTALWPGTVAEKPKSGSPTASDTSVVPQPLNSFGKLGNPSAQKQKRLVLAFATVAHVHRQMRNRTQANALKVKFAHICSRARLKRLLSAEVNARIATDSKGFRPIFNPPFSSRKEIR